MLTLKYIRQTIRSTSKEYSLTIIRLPYCRRCPDSLETLSRKALFVYHYASALFPVSHFNPKYSILYLPTYKILG